MNLSGAEQTEKNYYSSLTKVFPFLPGMISSAMVWGFLSDTLGRRKIMVWGFFCSGLVEIMAAMSQNFAMLLVTRFASGFL